jgi:Ca-activated chloride channel family protein
MSESLHAFHFLRPWWLLALLALPWLWWLATQRSRAQRELAKLVDAELLPHLLQGRAAQRHEPAALLSAGWLLAVLALAGPAWNRVASPLYVSRAAEVVAVSMSQHMLARDVAPSRLDRARYKAHDLFAANRGGLNGLIAYAGEAFVVAPLTTDAGSLGDLLDALAPDTMPLDGNDAAHAIERAADLIREAKAGGGTVVLLTDDADDAAIAAARKVRADGIVVSVLGIGSEQGAQIMQGDGGFLRDAQGAPVLAQRDDAKLRAVAEAGGGRYAPMSGDRSDIDALHTGEAAGGSGSMAAGSSSEEWQDRGPWLLLPLLPIAALGFRRGWLLLLPLALLPLLPTMARADSWSDLWRRPDQQAAAALRQGKSAQAQQLARDPAWRGAAAYRAGDYPAAAAALRQAQGGDAAYNLGNALARQGDYQAALAAYDRALKLDPADADAKANRQAVEDWLRKQQASQPPKPNDEKGSGQSGHDGKSKSQDKQKGTSQESPNDQQGQGRDKQDPTQAPPGKGGQPDGTGRDQPQPQGAQSPADGKPMTPKEQAEQQAHAEQARQALQRQLDRELEAKGTPSPDKKNQGHELGAAAADDPQAKLPADVRRALQRVPDDPGALLRRKFELEYRRRHGAGIGEDD